MNILVGVGGPGIDDERIDTITRDLLKEIRLDTDHRARLVPGENSPGSKGDVVSLGQIALALITGGAVGKLIESLFGFLGRNRKLQLELTNAAGEKLAINMDFVDRHGTEQATKLAEDFLVRDR
jgi:hypothetical protein